MRVDINGEEPTGTTPVVEWDGRETVTFDIGTDTTVVIRKMFGPTIFEDLRVRADLKTCQWVIERTTTIHDDEHSSHEEWREVARIEGQPEASA